MGIRDDNVYSQKIFYWIGIEDSQEKYSGGLAHFSLRFGTFEVYGLKLAKGVLEKVLQLREGVL